MNKFLLFLSLFVSTLSFAQADCDASSHDFGDVEYGVYPDTATGIAAGELNVPYLQTIYILVPLDASVISPLFASATLEEVSLVGISYDDGTGNLSDISNLGLTLECNPANCVFMPGEQYCGVISGVPNQVGSFPIVIQTEIQGVAFGFPINSPFDFDGYTFNVTGTASVSQSAEAQISIQPATPNPANNATRINVALSANETATVRLVNMVGEQVLVKSIQGKRGDNIVTLDVNDLPAGIYLYSVEAGTYKTTRKLVVEH
jgi:hypothetical protein